MTMREWIISEISKIGIDEHELRNSELIIKKFRNALEKPIFDKLRELYLDILRNHWMHGSGFSHESNYAICLYETRCHENLEFLIYNLYYYTTNWRMVFYCTKDVKEHVCSILGPNASTIQFIGIDDSNTFAQNYVNYERVLKSKEFWEMFHAIGISHIMIAQTDSYLRRHITDDIDIENIDYIASPWAWSIEMPGGGGLTIRRVTKALDIWNMYPTLAEEIKGEDGWFATGLVKLGGVVDKNVFAESVCNNDAYGLHQWWSFTWTNLTDELLLYCENCMKLEI
jgi:hypothetical protein